MADESPPPEQNQCKDVRPMGVWIKEPTKDCRPCTLGVVASWYRDTLNQNNMAEKARDLEAKAEQLDPVAFCEELDRIKEQTPELREDLLNFDCAAQNYKFEGEEVISDG
jgi:hypothetical protein